MSELSRGSMVLSSRKGNMRRPESWNWGTARYGLSHSLLPSMASLSRLAVPSEPESITSGPTPDLHIQDDISNIAVTCFVMGFGLGPLLLAPLSEAFACRPIVTLPSALTKNATTLVRSQAWRPPPMCNLGGTIADVWAMESRGAPMALFLGNCFLGLLIGSTIGQQPV